MARAQQVLTIDESVAGEESQRGGVYLDDTLPLEHPGRDVIAGQLAVWRIIGPEWEEFVIGDLAHALLRAAILRRIILSAPASSEPRRG
jgi:hypothetical protein